MRQDDLSKLFGIVTSSCPPHNRKTASFAHQNHAPLSDARSHPTHTQSRLHIVVRAKFERARSASVGSRRRCSSPSSAV